MNQAGKNRRNKAAFFIGVAKTRGAYSCR